MHEEVGHLIARLIHDTHGPTPPSDTVRGAVGDGPAARVEEHHHGRPGQDREVQVSIDVRVQGRAVERKSAPVLERAAHEDALAAVVEDA